MNWSYIAGFFDGEGCISLQTTRMQVSIYQSGSIGQSTLEEIQQWLTLEGIDSNLYHRKRFGTLSKKEMWELRISSRESQLKFLKSIRPYSRIKKILIQDCMRYFIIFPPNKWWLFGSGKVGDENRLVWNT
jgi:hypothetical protein